MPFLGKPLVDITDADLQSLVENEVPETKALEYKRELPKTDKDGKREVLADISAFANSSGGHIIFGMAETEGIASELVGLDVEDIDNTTLWFVNLVRSSIRPRLPDLNFQAVKLNSGKVAIITEIAKSWNAPHVVNIGKHWRFYARNSAGKYPLDVDEIRSQFIASESLREQIRNFTMDRYAQIMAGETPVRLEKGPRTAFHLIPLSAFSEPHQFDLANMSEKYNLQQIFGYNGRYNVDGYIVYHEHTRYDSLNYAQLYRNGIFECVATDFSANLNGTSFISSKNLEKELVEILDILLRMYRSTSISTPIAVFLGMFGYKNHYMEKSDTSHSRRPQGHTVDRDVLVFPSTLIEDFDTPAEVTLKPIFDTVWNACGWPGSMNYDETGNWQLRNQ